MEKELTAIERRAAGTRKTQLQPETEEKDSDSEEKTQFGVVWEKVHSTSTDHRRR